MGFDEALRMELNHLGAKGVSTTCVCPYYIDTGMFSGAGCRWPFNYLFPMLNPDYVANRVIYATRSSPIDHHCQCITVVRAIAD